MIAGNIAKIESMGLLDGPGVRTVVFMQGCILRCAYCHNPTFLTLDGGEKVTPEELLQKILPYKPYYKNGGGVTVSGGEPLIQTDFLTAFFTLCKQNNINTCLDTAGVGVGDFNALLNVTDYVLLDIKHTNQKEFKELTHIEKKRTEKFVEALNHSNAKVWIRQVIMPSYNDNEKYLQSLLEEIKLIKNIEKIEFLPFHQMAQELYEEYHIPYRLKDAPEMDTEKCKQLEQQFIAMYQPFNPNVK